MIIKAEKKDIPIIRKLAEKSWATTYNDILSKDQLDYMMEMMYSEETLGKHFENPDYQYYLVKENETFLGFIGFELQYEKETTKLHRIYFLKESQGKGLGKKTLDFLKNEVKKSRNKRIILTVNKNNNARKFYESQGFRVYDEAVFDIGNGYVMDDYLMEFLIPS